MTKKILIVTGESSGDMHGAALCRSLISTKPDIQVFAVGGAEMKKAGAHIIQDNKEMAVVGVVEIFGKFQLLYRIYKKIKFEILSGNYSGLVLIDYPTFNMILACIASKKGLPVFYYIAPQIWVWGRSRVKILSRTIAKIFVILPFEKEIYKQAGMDVEFVGHPLLDVVKTTMDKEQACQTFGLDKNNKIIGILPGSRNQEIKTLLPVMLKSAGMIKKEIPKVQFVLPLAKTVNEEEVSNLIMQSGLEIKIIKGHNYEVMSLADFLIVASGSVTLEAAILKKPMVLIYKLNFITYIIARIASPIFTIGLVNIISGKDIVPELKQEKVTPENIVACTLKALNDEKYYEQVKQELAKIEKSLGQKGAPQTTANSIINYLYERKAK